MISVQARFPPEIAGNLLEFGRMRKYFKGLLSKVGRNLITPELLRSPEQLRSEGISSVAQKSLWLKYRMCTPDQIRKLTFADVSFKVHSQTDEGGILLCLLALIGDRLKKSVEICAGEGQECNAANLIINHQWFGLLVDGNAQNVKRGRDWHQTHPSCYLFPPKFVNE